MASADKAINGYMAGELRVERERSNLVLEELTNLVDGGTAITEARRKMCESVWQILAAIELTEHWQLDLTS